jgi:catechol 2,3-dioxygenase-like lactoylglutathione lyase family enzyme
LADRATPNLPSRDLAATSQFYARLGFRETFRDDGWLILERGPLQIEFFPWPDHNPKKHLASCCLRASPISISCTRRSMPWACRRRAAAYRG